GLVVALGERLARSIERVDRHLGRRRLIWRSVGRWGGRQRAGVGVGGYRLRVVVGRVIDHDWRAGVRIGIAPVAPVPGNGRGHGARRHAAPPPGGRTVVPGMIPVVVPITVLPIVVVDVVVVEVVEVLAVEIVVYDVPAVRPIARAISAGKTL